MEIALSAICGPEDILTPLSGTDESLRYELTGLRAQNYKIPIWQLGTYDLMRWVKYGKRPEHSNHQTALLTKQRLGSKIWDAYFSFTLEREPKEKLVSHYQWLKMQGKCENPQQYISLGYFEKIRAVNSYADKNGNNLLNAVFVTSKMEVALQALSARFKIPQSDLKLPPQKVKKSKAASQTEQQQLLEYYQMHLKSKFALDADLTRDDLHI